MTFIVTLLALAIERFFDWTNVRHWSWYYAYQNYIVKRLANSAPYLVLAALVIPLVLAVNLVSFLISGWFYGFMTLLFQIAVLLYCLGPHNLWADTLATKTDHYYKDLNQIFIAANKSVFAVVFWFIVLGPAGAMLYRVVSLATADFARQDTPPVLLQSARVLEASLDWLPIRLLTFFFALGGHFTKVFANWRKRITSGLDANDMFITECGAAALGDEQAMSVDGSAEKNALALLDRTFVITLVFIAIFAIWL